MFARLWSWLWPWSTLHTHRRLRRWLRAAENVSPAWLRRKLSRVDRRKYPAVADLLLTRLHIAELGTPHDADDPRTATPIAQRQQRTADLLNRLMARATLEPVGSPEQAYAFQLYSAFRCVSTLPIPAAFALIARIACQPRTDLDAVRAYLEYLAASPPVSSAQDDIVRAALSTAMRRGAATLPASVAQACREIAPQCLTTGKTR